MGNKVDAIIQARMTSTRLPGKVLMEVMGKPLLNYQIERLRFSKMIESIIIATTTNKEDDRICELAQKEGLNLFRGSEDDVLDRYYQAAKEYKVKNVMRLTADCPLIASEVCDIVASDYFENDVDYICTGKTFAEGLGCEVIGFKALAKAWFEAKLKSEREHVTLYIRNHPELFRTMFKENDIDDSRYRITVDEEEDFIVVKAILEFLYKDDEIYFSINEIKRFFNENPDIYQINKEIIRNEGLLKSLRNDKIVTT
jgi:spore coat polysaccharide biosynthesis protein SpsF (cytidylyltransferase family)